jgi:hypothetical protein
MADEAFAISPISARAAQPSEQDYEAISQAFMETSRGRWFLGEYAKRNRNADTRMVLDAVERIEQSLAAQEQPASDSGLAEALSGIRSALDEARGTAFAALDSLALEENLAPVRKGARVIKEIAWRWREIGADARICDLIDSQVSAIESGCGRISSADARGALSAAFDLIQHRIAGFEKGDAAPLAAEQADASASPDRSPGPSDEMPAAASQAIRATTAPSDPDTTMNSANIPAREVAAAAQPVEMTADPAELAAEAAEIEAEAADAHDDAVLEMIALEMAAPDVSDADEASEPNPEEIHAGGPQPAEPILVARDTEPTAAASPAVQPTLQPSLEPALDASGGTSPQVSPKASLQVSLGSTLIAQGIVARPKATASDPLAPIRRLSQAEKIALFS